MAIHQPAELIQDAALALSMLKEGNARYVSNQLLPKNTYADDREVLAGGQKPFAVILTCSDSRVSPEIFFDQRLGDIFVVRNAGNVADPTALGSIEYAVEHLGTPLVAVVGHSHCGAVTAACGGGDLPPNIRSITDRIQPAVAKGGGLDAVIRANVDQMADQIRDDEIVRHQNARVVGAYYDVHTGVVTWL